MIGESMSLSIELLGVVKKYGANPALSGLDLRVERGGIVGVLGPNGAGKTTLLRVLLGLVRPDAGSVRVLGLDPIRDGTRLRGQVGVLLEHDGIYPRLSAEDNLLLHARLQHVPESERAPRIETLLQAFGLWQRRRDRAGTWSVGMRKRLSIARSLLHAPSLLLLDEPFSGLDPVAAADLRELILAHARQHRVTVLSTTHDLAHAEKICSEVAVLENGRVLARGAPDRLGEGSGPADGIEATVVADGLDATLLDALVADGWLTQHRLEGRVATIVSPTPRFPRLTTELVRRGAIVEEVKKTGPSLEAAFIALTRRQRGAA
jgi:ABC-2 type transport system ATP-binding protein